jgi:hypothetical protein
VQALGRAKRTTVLSETRPEGRPNAFSGSAGGPTGRRGPRPDEPPGGTPELRLPPAPRSGTPALPARPMPHRSAIWARTLARWHRVCRQLPCVIRWRVLYTPAHAQLAQSGRAPPARVRGPLPRSLGCPLAGVAHRPPGGELAGIQPSLRAPVPVVMDPARLTRLGRARGRDDLYQHFGYSPLGP